MQLAQRALRYGTQLGYRKTWEKINLNLKRLGNNTDKNMRIIKGVLLVVGFVLIMVVWP